MLARYCWVKSEEWISWIDNRSGIDWKLGGGTLREHMSELLTGWGMVEGDGEDALHLSEAWLPTDRLLAEIVHGYLRSMGSESPVEPDFSVMVQDAEGTLHPVAWAGEGEPETNARILTATAPEIRRLVYPWDFLPLLEELTQDLLKNRSKWENLGIHRVDRDLYQGDGILLVGADSQIKPGVVVEGIVVAGKGTRLGPNCYLRGPISLGDHCVVGQAVELKNTVVGNDTAIPHLSYVGDSVLGSRINLGAGSKCSNYRHDGAIHRALLPNGTWISTSRTKWGAVLGHDVKLGCNTTIYPSRFLPPNYQTRPGEIVTYVPQRSGQALTDRP